MSLPFNIFYVKKLKKNQGKKKDGFFRIADIHYYRNMRYYPILREDEKFKNYRDRESEYHIKGRTVTFKEYDVWSVEPVVQYKDYKKGEENNNSWKRFNKSKKQWMRNKPHKNRFYACNIFIDLD